MGGKFPPTPTRELSANFSLGTASPPETPTASPVARRKNNCLIGDVRQMNQQSGNDTPSYSRSRAPPPHPAAPSPTPADISVAPHLRFSQISPQSSPSDLSDPEFPGSESMEASSSEDSDSDSESNAATGPRRCGPGPPTLLVAASPDRGDLEVEELSDFDPMDSDREDALKPAGYEYPESELSRPGSRNGPIASGLRELDREMMETMQNLTCSNESDGEFDDDDVELREFVRWQKERKRRHRISHGSSVGKRTVSERGDSDREDLKPFQNGVSPASDRRTRRRVGERRSSIFQDHTPERIPELDEPDSEDSGEDSEGNLARQLPYFDLEVMEVDDSD